MRPLTANVKHLVQRRVLWLLYVWLAFLALTVLFASCRLAPGRSTWDGMPGFLWTCLMMGMLAGLTQKETLVKPFSFGLPGHRAVCRRFLVWVGVAASVLGAVVYATPRAVTPYAGLLALLATAAVGLAGYLLTVLCVLHVNHSAQAFGILALGICAGMAVGAPALFMAAVRAEPALTLATGILVSAAIWRRLGSVGLFRQQCGKPFLGLTAMFSPRKSRAYAEQVAVGKLARRDAGKGDDLNGACVAYMSRRPPFGLAASLAGAAYEIVGRRRPGGLALQCLALVLMAIAFGYLTDARALNVLYVLPACVCQYLRLPAARQLLVPAGRRERFEATLVVSVATGTVATGAMALAAACTGVLEPILPTVTVRGASLTFHAMDMRHLYLVPLVVPGALISNLLVRDSVLPLIAMTMCFPLAVFAAEWSAAAGPVLVAGLVAAMWALWLFALHRRCFRGDLADASG